MQFNKSIEFVGRLISVYEPAVPNPPQSLLQPQLGTCLRGQHAKRCRRDHDQTPFLCLLALLITVIANAQSTSPDPKGGAEMTGTIKEYTPSNVLVLEDLAPSEPVQFKLAKNVSYADADGKPIEAAGLTTPKGPCPLHQSRRRQRGRQSHLIGQLRVYHSCRLQWPFVAIDELRCRGLFQWRRDQSKVELRKQEVETSFRERQFLGVMPKAFSIADGS
jgi:hypothetical protein